MERIKKNLFRVLRPATLRKNGKIYFKDKKLFDFSSNDYLALAGHPKMEAAAKKAAEELGTSASASRLLSGDLEIHHLLEERIAAFKNKESALVFNSGYQANVGIISSFIKRGDAVFSDRLNHASILDGISLSGGKLFRFLHNDTEHLKGLLEAKRDKFKNCLIITETIFSMDGDRAPLADMVKLKEKYKCMLMVDEAHATGVFGKNGSGVVEEEGLTGGIDLIMGTFSKALASFGAYVAASKEMTEYLINVCRSFIYSTALPPTVVAANLAGLELVGEEPYRRKELLENADYFRDGLQKKGLEVKGSSQIVPLIVKDTEKAIKLSARLREAGYMAPPIRPPTVPAGGSRLRFSLTHHHGREVLDDLVKAICRHV